MIRLGLPAWRAIAIVWGAIALVSTFNMLRESGAEAIPRTLGILLGLSAIGGFVFQRRLLWRWVWQLLLVLHGALIAFYVLGAIVAEANGAFDSPTWQLVAIEILLEGMFVAVLFQYTFNCKHLWYEGRAT